MVTQDVLIQGLLVGSSRAASGDIRRCVRYLSAFKFSEGFHDSYSNGLINFFINMMALVRDSPEILWHHLGPSRTLHALLLIETALTVQV